jgi:hypothetical protein
MLIAGGLLVWLDAAHNWVLLIRVLVGGRLMLEGLLKIHFAFTKTTR